MTHKPKYGSVEAAVNRAASTSFALSKKTVLQAATDPDSPMRLDIPGGYRGPFRIETVPYLGEVMETFTSRLYTATVLVGSQQSAKTEIIPCWAYHSATCEPADLLLYEKTKDTAHKFEMQRLARPIAATPEWKRALGPLKSDDNIYSKKWRNGSALILSWPSINEMSGKPVAHVALTDYDRMPQDVDGNGNPFDLAAKRTETFLTRGHTLAESSPGFPVIDPDNQYDPGEHHPHEAPPTIGILSLYNRGDRRRWYWPCLQCGEYFIGEFDCLTGYEEAVKKGADWVDIAQSVYMRCPHGHRMDQGQKAAMNRQGRWVAQGQWIEEGELLGDRDRRSPIASFWFPGPVAFRQNWGNMVVKYLQAKAQYELTGEEEPLKTTVLSDQAKPYRPVARETDRTASSLSKRAEEMGERQVPRGVRFLIATVDVQGGKQARFEVLISGIGRHGELWVIDRFAIETINGKRVQPNARVEDWRVIKEQVIHRVYPLEDNSGRWMGIKATSCDCVGEDGVTEQAHAFWREMKRDGFTDRFMLTHGRDQGPIVQKTTPEKVVAQDARGKTIQSQLLAEVYRLNVNILKDGVDKALERKDPGPNYIHFPSWFPLKYFKELTVESRNEKGKWGRGSSRSANETWVLLVYCRGVLNAIGAIRIVWDAINKNKQGYALPWKTNPLVFSELQDHHYTGMKHAA